MPEIWRKCSSCKKDILNGQTYYVCSVSTCQSRVTNYAFCSVPCWDAHVPVERHKPESAGAIERKAPATGSGETPRRVIPANQPAAKAAPSGGTGASAVDDEILVVVTKVRKYIADHSGLSTSAGVYEALTERLHRICDRAIENAKAAGRKTVMDRDVP